MHSKQPTTSDSQRSSEIAAHRRQLSEQRVRLESAAEGSWLVHVHIIESRELRATDPDGTADPVCIIEVVFGDGPSKHGKRVTRIVHNDRNAVFDEHFKFEFPNLTRPDIEMGQVAVTVVDSDVSVAGHGVGDVIGSWSADILDSIYSRPDHEFYRRFVCLENASATNSDESGTQGFLKLTVSATGPGDKAKVHNVEKEKALEKKLLAEGGTEVPSLSLPAMTPVVLRFLVVKIHSVDNLRVPAGSCFVKIEVGYEIDVGA